MTESATPTSSSLSWLKWPATALVVVLGLGFIANNTVSQLREVLIEPAPMPGPSPTPNIPNAAILEATFLTQLDPILNGDSAAYYAGVWDGLAEELQDERGIDTWDQLQRFLIEMFKAADRQEPSPVQVKPIVAQAFAGYDQRSGNIGESRQELIVRVKALANAARKSR